MFDRVKFRLYTHFYCANQGLMPIRYIHSHDFGGSVCNDLSLYASC